jgi:hypothetical protein
MKTLWQKAKVFFPFMWMVCGYFPVQGMCDQEPPESVVLDYLHELYEPVHFDHQMHSEMYDCCSCHHHTTGDGVANKTCERCHSGSVPLEDVSCSGCHQYKNTGTPSQAVPAKGPLYHIDKPDLKGALHLQCLGCHQSENGPTGCQECHEFTPEGRTRFALKK